MAARKRKRMGRPPKPAAEKLDYAVQANLTAAEYRELVALAAGEPLAVFLRRLVLGRLAQRRRTR
jgi:hypothetical protein